MKNKKVGYIIIIVVLMIFIGISSFFIMYFYDTSRKAIGLKSVVYKEKSEINPHVVLKNDEYYQGSDSGVYITNLIDKIQNNFSYTLTFNSRVTGEYDYKIMGIINAHNGDSTEEILNKALVNGERKKYHVDGNVIDINDEFTMDFAQYYADYNQFRESSKIDLAGYMLFQVTINYQVYSEDIADYITGSKNLSVLVPLDNTTTKLTISPAQEETLQAFKEQTAKEKRLYSVIYLEFIEAIILFVLIIVILIKKIVHKETDYEYHMRHIFDDYEEILVEVAHLPDLTNYEVLFITNFNDLVDTQNELHIPIIYREVIKKRETVFMILHENKAYVYKLTDKIKSSKK